MIEHKITGRNTVGSSDSASHRYPSIVYAGLNTGFGKPSPSALFCARLILSPILIFSRHRFFHRFIYFLSAVSFHVIDCVLRKHGLGVSQEVFQYSSVQAAY